MRLGVLDVGSNTVHLLVVDAYPGARPLPAFSHKAELKLADQLDNGSSLSRPGERSLRDVVVEVRLLRSVASIAREGSVFWIVRLGTELQDISNLGTVITGAYIQVLPGTGEPKSDFVGLEGSKVALDPGGLEIVLRTSRLGSLKPSSPVYYRGIEVGAVRTVQLSSDATVAEIHLQIKPRYVKLVRGGSKFWNASGADVKLGLFSGLEINVESLKSLVGGGIVFATPSDAKSRQAMNGAVFALYEQPAKEWLEWAPRISIPPEENSRQHEGQKK